MTSVLGFEPKITLALLHPATSLPVTVRMTGWERNV
jgi:hypothetical protein